MKKFKLLSIIVVGIFLVFLIIIKFSEKPEDVLQKHLKNRYNKEFVIYYGGNRSDGRSKWFEAEIYPKELVGTIREYDKYYWAKGFVENGKGGDTYGGVLLNESANEFYLPKLKELFGENVLPVLNVEGYYEKTDFQEEMARRKELYKKYPEGRFFPISGGIYIFGRVENDEDREKYREEIYKFLSFMKETGTFEYVSLNIAVVDERILSEEYQNNPEFVKRLIEKAETDDMEWQEYRDFRRKLYSENFSKNYTLKINFDDINRTKVLDHVGEWSNYNALLYIKIYSPKYLESNPAIDSEIIPYNDIKDVKFDYETW